MREVYKKGPWGRLKGEVLDLVDSRCTHCTHKQLGQHSTSIQLLDHLQSIHSRCSDTEVCHLWCFSLADLIVGVQMAARAPLCPLLFRYSQTEQHKDTLAREDKLRTKTTLVNRREQHASQMLSLSNLSFGSPITRSLEINLFKWFMWIWAIVYAKAKIHLTWIEDIQLNMVKRYLEDTHY